jgi:hypothetical protein
VTKKRGDRKRKGKPARTRRKDRNELILQRKNEETKKGKEEHLNEAK